MILHELRTGIYQTQSAIFEGFKFRNNFVRTSYSVRNLDGRSTEFLAKETVTHMPMMHCFELKK